MIILTERRHEWIEYPHAPSSHNMVIDTEEIMNKYRYDLPSARMWYEESLY